MGDIRNLLNYQEPSRSLHTPYSLSESCHVPVSRTTRVSTSSAMASKQRRISFHAGQGVLGQPNIDHLGQSGAHEGIDRHARDY